jgi:hypothetical protein
MPRGECRPGSDVNSRPSPWARRVASVSVWRELEHPGRPRGAGPAAWQTGPFPPSSSRRSRFGVLCRLALTMLNRGLRCPHRGGPGQVPRHQLPVTPARLGSCADRRFAGHRAAAPACHPARPRRGPVKPGTRWWRSSNPSQFGVDHRAAYRDAGHRANLPAGVGRRCGHARAFGRDGVQSCGGDRHDDRADARSGECQGHHQRQVRRLRAEAGVRRQQARAEQQASSSDQPARGRRARPAASQQRREDHQDGHGRERQRDAVSGVAGRLPPGTGR